jgi:hypothetical protein
MVASNWPVSASDQQPTLRKVTWLNRCSTAPEQLKTAQLRRSFRRHHSDLAKRCTASTSDNKTIPQAIRPRTDSDDCPAGHLT